MIAIAHWQTPLGVMRMAATDAGICLFDFEYRKSMDGILKRISSQLGQQFIEAEHPLFEWLKAEMTEYFKGTRTEFDVPLQPVGTAFQMRVWQAIQQIPYGETQTYKQQSIALGNELAIRAVAGANGENGIAIIIPCHRVIGTNGSLVGYGGGLNRKKWLLEHEARHTSRTGQISLF